MTTQKTKKNWFIKHLSFKKESLFTLFLAALLLVSGIQVVELVIFQSKLDSQTIKPASATPATGSLDDLPDMVGGC